MRNGLRFWTCFLLVITLLGTADGKAETFQKYIFAGAAGDGSGSDWNNAYPAVPGVLQRDTVYYFAGGSYGCRIIDTAVSGNKQVIFRKATPGDHGTSVGWSDRMADAPAKFDCLQIFTSYVTIDGSTGTGTAGYGFEVFLPEATYHLISVPAGFPDQTDITIKHCELHFASRYSEKQAHALYFPAGTRNLYIGFNYIHDIPGSAFLSRFCNNIFFEYNYVSRNRSTPEWHAEGWSDGGSSNVTVRYNTWEDIEGTGILVNLNAGSPSTAAGWQIYGNVFFLSENTQSGGYGNGIIACINAQVCTNWKIYNNTISNIVSGLTSRIFFEVPGAGNEVKDNLWYCEAGRNCKPADHVNVNTVDYNYYASSIPHPAEAHEQIGPANPFVNPAARNFRLKAPTIPGISLGAPFNRDLEGKTRGADGNWDRGAYQFSTQLPAPKGLRILPK